MSRAAEVSTAAKHQVAEIEALCEYLKTAARDLSVSGNHWGIVGTLESMKETLLHVTSIPFYDERASEEGTRRAVLEAAMKANNKPERIHSWPHSSCTPCKDQMAQLEQERLDRIAARRRARHDGS